ncbi:S8 family peptidase [Bacillus songklensis]|uniref:S8 family peptidase n=1 Tax=Bacillus songklensis TaxID=1069116 RepID=A0ABV8B147_9BACI
MRKRYIMGIVTFLLAFGILTTTHLHRQDGDQATHVQNNRVKTQRLKAQNITAGSPELLKVNMIRMNDATVERLNNHPTVHIIDHNGRDKSHYYKNEVTVKFKIRPNDTEIVKITRDIDGKLIKRLDSACIFRSNSQSTSELIQHFEKSENVVYAEPHYILLQNEVNDQFYQRYQWNLPAIDAETGWELTQGAKNVKIAVVDTGVDLEHPDLARRLLKGYNVLANNDRPDDDNGHGTHVAGIIASETNNGQGVAGITWYNPIMPVKAMNEKGYGSSFDIAKGIRWAVDNGADVINLSLGNYQPSSILKEAIDYAYSKNVIVVAASGNDNSNQPSFPAAFPQVLSVGAVGWDGRRAPFSNYGTYMDVAAPGVSIASTYPGGQYAALSGTSMAAPHVTALAGLIRSLNPGLPNTEVMNIIIRTTRDAGQPGPDVYYGSGVVDIAGALRLANQENHPDRKKNEWNWFNFFSNR